MGEESRAHADEDLSPARRAWKEFAAEVGLPEYDTLTARDAAMFDAGFKRGRRSPGPDTEKMTAMSHADVIEAAVGFGGLAEKLMALAADHVVEHGLAVEEFHRLRGVIARISDACTDSDPVGDTHELLDVLNEILSDVEIDEP